MNEQETLTRLLDFIFDWTLKIFLFALPLFWLPLTTDYFEFNKLWLFFLVVLVLLGVWGLKMLVTRTVYFRPTPFDLPLFLVLLTTILAAVFSTNRYYSLFGVVGNFDGAALTMVATYGFFYAVVSNCGRPQGVPLPYFTTGATISALLYLFDLIGVNTGAWSHTTGSGLNTVTTYIIAAMVGAATLYSSFLLGPRVEAPEDDRWKKTTKTLAQSFYLCSIVLLLGAVLVTATPLKAFVADTLEVSNASLTASWNIAATTVANRPFFGSGPATWQNDYALYKPLSVNESAEWNTRFTKAGSFYLQVLAENGLLGFVAWLVLVGAVVGGASLNSVHAVPVRPVAIGILILWLVVPSSTVAVVVFAILLGEVGARHAVPVQQYHAPVTATALAIFTGLLLALAIYGGYKVYAAEYFFKQSLTDLETNEGRQTYKLQQTALTYNPWPDRYHRAYVQTNVALAGALLQQTANSKQQSAQETVNALLTQASREVQLLTEGLGPTTPDNWEARGSFYYNLVNVSKEATSLAISAYQQAISLDPYSPRLRLELGNLYLTASDLPNAIATLRIATLLKSDLASAHYSLAQAYKANKEYGLAVAELKSVTLGSASLPFSEAENVGAIHESPVTTAEQINAEIAELEQLVSKANVAGASTSAQETKFNEASPSATSNTVIPAKAGTQ